ncbi:MAG: DUF4105 domain-containing protein [Verrucomicrobiota bacterium]
MEQIRNGLGKAGKFLLGMVLAALHLWALLALYFWFMGPSVPALMVTVLYALGVWGSFRLAKTRSHGALVGLVLFVVVAVWWTRREPGRDLLYPVETAEAARIETELNMLTVSGMREFHYRATDSFDERWTTRSFDLEKLQYVDLYFIRWGLPGVAHIITSFVFEDSPPLAVSIELRREKDEPHTLLRGFFKQYELHYVWADERDVIRLRTNFRKEDVYLHRTDLTPAQAKKMLQDMASRSNRLSEHPEFYDTLTDSCANAVSQHLMRARGKTVPFFRQPLSPAAYEKLGWDEGWLLHSKPEWTADREASHVNARAEQSPDDGGFYTRIRTHLPTPEVERSYGSGAP